MHTRKRIDRISVRYLVDEDPEISYLKEEDFEERLRQWQRGEFHYIGIRAEATVCAEVAAKVWKEDKLTSWGLWSIESDSEAAYVRSVEDEELAELKVILAAYGFGRTAIAKAFKNVERPD